MSTRLHIARTLVAVLAATSIIAGYAQEPRSFDRIFGSGPDYNGMALVVDDKHTIQHDTTTCSMRGISKTGKTLWVTDLSAYGCDLLYFATIPEDGLMGCDVVVQFMDKRVCVIRSSNGKMKFMSEDDMERARQKAKKKEKKKVTCDDSKCLGVPLAKPRVALSASSPRADYRAVGFPLQSLTRNQSLRA